MIRADQIPPDAMYAAWKAMNAGMTLNDAISAALNAWPGAVKGYRVDDGKPWIKLPMPQEVSDDT